MKQRAHLLLITTFALLVAGCGGYTHAAMQAGGHSHHARTAGDTNMSKSGHTSRPSVSIKEDLSPVPMCQTAPTVEYIAEPQAGDQSAVVQELGSNLLAVLTLQPSTQVVDLIGPSYNLSSQSTVASDLSTFASVAAPSAQPALRSCNFLLSDAPADAPLVDAALQASVGAGVEPDLADAKAALELAYVSDDPLSSADVIVTLEFPGPAVSLGPNAPITHGYDPFTAIETESVSTVLAATAGGFN